MPGYPREDYRTNTVDGAAAFERGRAAYYDEDFIDDDYAEARYDDESGMPDFEDLEPECNCSDPCCDCSGRKRGTP